MRLFISHVVLSFRETFPVKQTEWLFSLSQFLFAFVLVWNPNLFNENATFEAHKRFMDQEIWALLLFTNSTVRICVLLINGAWRRTPHLRAICAFFSSGFWFLIVLNFMQSGIVSTWIAVYPLALLFDCLNVFRASEDAGHSDRLHRSVQHNGNYK